MIIDLSNKGALVGGSSSGLGKAIALQLATSGASVTLLSRNEEKLINTLQQLPATAGQKHQYIVANFSDFESYKKIIAKFFSANHIDILVNNTNGPNAGNVLQKNEHDYLNAFNMLFQTVQYTTAMALPHMQAQKYGRIINLTSRTVKEPVENLALSNTIRAAITTWAKTLANAVAKDHITVNNILTGNFDTNRLRSLFKIQAENQNTSIEKIIQESEQNIPAGRLGKPQEMANVVTFLASELASYVTGTSIAVDGGLIKSL